MKLRLLIALAVVGFAAPWLVVGIQMHQAAPLQTAPSAVTTDP